MSRTEGAGSGARRGAEQQQEDAAQSPAEREARGFSEETGYRPGVNQRRHEPLPASRHDERRQEAVVRNEEHASDRPQAAPSPRAPGRRKGKHRSTRRSR